MHFLHIRQNFPPTPPVNVRSTLEAEFEKVRSRIKPRMRIAVGVGSRGITNLAEIVATTLDILRTFGARPFIFPAMGSHGGATPEGQSELLASYGITEAAMGVPIRDSLEVRQVGVTMNGVPAWCSVEALDADGIVLINRIKPHTDFAGKFGSGIVKMSVIGLGKRMGASAMHGYAARFGYEHAILELSRIILKAAPILCGVAILESQHHETARLSVLPAEDIMTGEQALFLQAAQLLPRLPFDEIDLLILDRIGKNISGSGMDPNVTGRSVQGYSSALKREGRPSPFIRRIFVRDLTPESHGNAIGIGLADLTTTRLVQAMDRPITYTNALNALSMQSSKIPIHFDTDREAIEQALLSLALPDVTAARVVRIADTLSLTDLEVSEALWPEVRQHPGLAATGVPHAMTFDAEGNLPRYGD